MAIDTRRHIARSELALFPFTAALRLRMRVMLLLMAVVACGLAIVQREVAWYGPGAFAVLSVVPMELVFVTVRRRRMVAYCNGEDRVGIVVKKRTIPIGPRHAVVIRYSMRDTVLQSSREIPFKAWLHLRVGASLRVRVDPEQPRNWVFCWEESDSGGGAAGLSIMGAT